MDIHSQRGAHAALPFFKLPPVGVVSAPANIPFQRIGFQPPTEPVTHNAEPVLDAANHVAVSIMSDAVGAGFLFFRNDSQNFRHGFSHNLLQFFQPPIFDCAHLAFCPLRILRLDL